MFNLNLCIVIAFSLLKNAVNGTSDITLSMYMYLANHLTPQECLKLTAYLYAEGLELMAVKELGNNNIYLLVLFVSIIQKLFYSNSLLNITYPIYIF